MAPGENSICANVQLLFFAALPPDVREVFDLPEAGYLFFFGATPPC